ncbi:MAG: glycerophosphodiester phosphodiesterase, partial [Anaerolineae bacterium]|nr:glycerophosphodiester phosphodiesterase [Anaerolineae bacterium]
MRSKILAIVLVVVVAFIAVLAVLNLTAKAAPACPPCLPDAPRPLVIAHQGGEEVWPSNTMYAYEHAVALGVDMLEMDL